MERKTNESFDAYKARRAAANQATGRINFQSRSGHGPSPRADRPRHRGIGIKGMASSRNTVYGANLKNHFDGMRQ